MRSSIQRLTWACPMGQLYSAVEHPRTIMPGSVTGKTGAAGNYSPRQELWPAERIEDRDVPEGGRHHGKPSSWALVAVVVAAFATGGIAIITHIYWLL
jgi:hypothetical protein